MRIFLVRHGEAKRSGQEDFGLTEKGVDQIQDLAGHLPRVDRVVTSTLPRAIQTGEIITSVKGESFEQLPALCEMGELANNFDESFLEFQDRVNYEMHQIAHTNVRSTLVVTHAGFIMGSIRTLFNIPTPGTGARLEPEHASITEWRHHDGVWELSSYNLTCS